MTISKYYWNSVNWALPPLNKKVFVYDNVEHTAYFARLKTDELGKLVWKSVYPFAFTYYERGKAITLWKFAEDPNLFRKTNKIKRTMSCR